MHAPGRSAKLAEQQSSTGAQSRMKAGGLIAGGAANGSNFSPAHPATPRRGLSPGARSGGPYTGRGCEHGGAVRRDRTHNDDR